MNTRPSFVHLLPLGNGASLTRVALTAVMAFVLALTPHTSAAQDAWVQLGPEGGEARGLVIDPLTPSIVYVGTSYGGVFRSLDAGATWATVNQGLTDTFVWSLAINPVTPTTIYAGTVHGIFRSTDRGDHWLPSASGVPEGGVGEIVVDPAAPTTVYAWHFESGIIRSTDGGVNWTPFNTGLPAFFIDSFTMDPVSSTLYVGMSTSLPFDPFNPGGGVYRRMPGDGSWTPYGTNLGGLSIIKLYVDGGSPSIVYAQTANNGLFKRSSIDPTWFLIASSFLSAPDIGVALGPPYITYVASGSSVQKSTTFWSFQSASTGLPSLESIVRMRLDPQTPSTLYTTFVPSGVYKSTDSAASWTRLSGVTAHDVHSIVFDPTASTTLYASTAWGVYRSLDSGVNWTRINSGGWDPIAISPQSPVILYGGFVAGSTIGRSLDGGATWTSVTVSATDISGVRAIAVDPDTPSIVYAGTGSKGVYRSGDFGVTWTAPASTFGSDRTTALVIDPQQTSTLYAGTRFLGVWRSQDAGVNWTRIINGLTSGDVRALAIDSTNTSTIYAGTASGVFKSVDSGNSWTPVNSGLARTSLDVRTLAFDDQSHIVYAGIFGYGIYRSLDGGTSWTAFNDGLDGTRLNVQVLVLEPNAPGVLYIGTQGSSVLRKRNAPAIAQVAPATLVRGTTMSLTVTGTNFVPDHTTIAPMAGITIDSVQVSSPTGMTVALTIDAGAAMGARAFVAQTPSGSSSALALQISDPFPDLSISSPGTSSYGEGAHESYDLVVRNVGSAPTASASIVTTTLPAGLTFVSASTGWTCATQSAQLTCTWNAPIAAGGSVPLTLTLSAGNGSGGSHTVAVTTAGDLNADNDSVTHVGTIVNVPLPHIALSSTSLQPGQQINATITLPSAFPHDLTGTLTLGFSSDAVVQGDDPAIQFASGGREVSYVIPANTLTARIGSNPQPGPIGFQTGTVSGTLSLTGTVVSGPIQLTFAPSLPAGGLTITRQAPTIHSVETRSAGGFAAYVLLSSTAREVTSLSLQFATTTPVQLSCGAVIGCSASGSTITLDVRALFNEWFAAHTSLGSLGVLRLPLTVESGLHGSVSVRLQNSVGTSTAGVFNLP